jgi:uncharacterized membrane protein YecN with MAPEG domain
MAVPVTALYAGILALIGMVLALGAGRLRPKLGISVLDGGNSELAFAMRRHGNWAEFVPIALVLFGVLELNGVGALPLHVMGGALVIARIAHPIGLGPNIKSPLRGLGAGLTFLTILVASVWSITTFF